MPKTNPKPKRGKRGKRPPARPPARAPRGPMGQRGRVDSGKGAARTPPRRMKPGPKPKPKPLVVITSYKAQGTIRENFGRSPGGLKRKYLAGDLDFKQAEKYLRKRARYFELQSEAPKGFPDSPGAWSSNEGLFLGQVNFPGRVKLATLERMLNEALNLVDRRGRVRRFQDVYSRWKWKYQVFTKDPTTGRKSIDERRSDSK